MNATACCKAWPSQSAGSDSVLTIELNPRLSASHLRLVAVSPPVAWLGCGATDTGHIYYIYNMYMRIYLCASFCSGKGCMWLCMHGFMHVRTCESTHVYFCMHVCVHVCVYVYACLQKDTRIQHQQLKRSSP